MLKPAIDYCRQAWGCGCETLLDTLLDRGWRAERRRLFAAWVGTPAGLANFCGVTGLALIALGMVLTYGLGPACIVAGVLLLAGGIAGARGAGANHVD